MALETRRPSRTDEEIRADAAARVARLLQQLDDDQYQERQLAELVQRVESFEHLFGLRSEDVGPAIDAGKLIEDEAVCDWLLDFHQLQPLGVR